ncbi:MAG: hypothetical protein ACRD1C_10295 [Terriglobales bacterium]
MAIGLGVRVELTADPAAAEAGLEKLWAVAPVRVRARLEQDRGLAQALVSVLAGSEYLTEALLRFPDWVLWLAEERQRPSRAPEDWGAALGAFTRDVPVEERGLALARFQRREYLRIAARDLQGQVGLAETTRELSDLADAVLQLAFVWSWNELVGQFGTPQVERGGGAAMSVLALGKLGGGELNYSSDIDLVFAYEGEGRTRGGGEVVDNAEFFTRQARSLIRYVSEAKGDRAAYRVDLRLRPGGREGELVPSRAAWEQYYRKRAREWELQMLVRARGCAGTRTLAEAMLAAVSELVYPNAPEAERLAAGVRASRAAIRAEVEQRRVLGHKRDEMDVKLDAGGIRDVEFLTQYWQRLHGGTQPWVRSGHTLLALQRLHDAKRIGGSELQTLAQAYTLLRHTEHRVQLWHGQQTHALPPQPERRAALARSLATVDREWHAHPAGSESGISAAMEAVRELYAHYLEAGAGEPAGTQPGMAPLAWPEGVQLGEHGRHQAQRLARSLATTPGGEALWSRLAAPVRVRLAAALETSGWMAQLLIRRPQLAEALGAEAAAPPPPPQNDLGASMTALRTWQQGEWLRLLSQEWETARAIGASLALQTELVTAALQVGLELAGGERVPSLAILGLGRLGLGELDLLSDVDVVFVAAEEEREAAATVAARWIEILTAYTQAGPLYAVDARLRPGGREGELVQTPASLELYFARPAGLWEALSYAKARWVAGDAGTAARALAAVREPVRQRWAGRNMRTGLQSLRERMEREGRPGAWGLKTVAGGYYDVDFALSQRLLEEGGGGAGARGLAEWARAAGEEELADLVGYLRAADHALRVATGKAGAAVPAAGAALERAWRWLANIAPAVPPAASPAALATERIAAARARIRAIYQQRIHR